MLLPQDKPATKQPNSIRSASRESMISYRYVQLQSILKSTLTYIVAYMAEEQRLKSSRLGSVCPDLSGEHKEDLGG